MILVCNDFKRCFKGVSMQKWGRQKKNKKRTCWRIDGQSDRQVKVTQLLVAFHVCIEGTVLIFSFIYTIEKKLLEASSSSLHNSILFIGLSTSLLPLVLYSKTILRFLNPAILNKCSTFPVAVNICNYGCDVLFLYFRILFL